MLQQMTVSSLLVLNAAVKYCWKNISQIVTLKLQIKKRIPNINYLGSLFSSQHRKARQMQILQQSDLQKL
jgi:hypothetical protein